MKSLVNSFDIFDTLIGRISGSPDTIFDEVEQLSEHHNFKHIRKLAEHKSNGTWDDIWFQFKLLTRLGDNDVDIIKNLEWSIEKDRSFPIMTNIMLLRSKDILVSDMYLQEDMVEELLFLNGIKSYAKLYLSPNGKRSGEIWSVIDNDGYSIVTHTGDNIECDILSPKTHNIKTSYFDAKYSDKETILFRRNKKELANLLRIIRLSNVYSVFYENKSIIWNILSNIIPFCSVIFNGSNKNSYELEFPDLYFYYLNRFDSFIKDDDKRIVSEMIGLSNFYSEKLKIKKTYEIDKDIIFYATTCCDFISNDIL